MFGSCKQRTKQTTDNSAQDTFSVVLDTVDANESDTQVVNIQEEITVLQAIRNIIDIVGFVELPYKIYHDQDGILMDEYNANYLWKIRVQNGCLYGVLPDTTHYYGILYCLAASVAIPVLTIFDKEGNLIFDRQRLLEQNCHKMIGIGIFCNEYIIINEDLTLHYHYSAKDIYDNILSGKNDALDCEHIEKEGEIDENGKVIFGESKTIPVENCEFEIMDVATSFYYWYFDFYKEKDPTIQLNIVKGENNFCTLQNVDNYMQALRNLGTLTESFLEREHQRILACKNYLETYSWDLYQKSAIYEVIESTPCETTWRHWLHNTQEDITSFNINDCKQMGNIFEFVINFYTNNDVKKDHRQYFEAVQRVVKQNDKWLIDEITTRRRIR